MIRAVLFDLFETLVSERGTVQTRASRLGPALQLDAQAFRTAWKQRRSRLNRGEESFAQALLAIGARLGVELDPEVVRRLGELRVTEKAVVFQRIDPDVLATVHGLRDRGIRLGVVSNCFAEDVEAWSRCDLAPQFDAAVFSFSLGAAKPDLRIYIEAVRALGVDPAETLFVGDGADAELHGALAAGLDAARAAWFLDKPEGAVPPTTRLRSPREVIEFVGGRSRPPSPRG